MKKCINCNKTYEKTKNIRIDLGIAVIEQKQCPYCQCPVNTKIRKAKYEKN